MFFSIDPSNGVAIYEQIVRQVKFGIADQTLTPGQLIPSVRSLAQELAINPNTINRAFRELQEGGIITPLRGRGMVVCEGATEQCKSLRVELIAERFRSVLTEALHGGLSRTEIRRIVTTELDRLAGNVATVSDTESPPG